MSNSEGASAGASVAIELLKAAGNDPNAKSAGQQLGKTALTVTTCINNALIPIAALNFGFKKAQDYFTNRFPSEMEMKAATIPPENLTEPKASIVGPALQGLAFAHEEENLKEMYLSLLSSSMDSRSQSLSHPAFVEMLRQLTSKEARLLNDIYQMSERFPIVEVRLVGKDQSKGWFVLLRHLLNLVDSETKMAKEDSDIPAFVDNWIRLGLIEVDYTKHLSNSSAYEAFDSRPEIIRFKEKHKDKDGKIELAKGIMIRTSLGDRFATVVGVKTS